MSAAIDDWRARVWRMLRDGYEPEAIADRLACDVQIVRTQIKVWRELGVLRSEDWTK